MDRISNMIFDGPAEDEDFGLEQITGDSNDRYLFRTSPLRNVALQRTFFHNGCFIRLEDAVRHHLDSYFSARNYDPIRAGVASDLTDPPGPIEPVLARLDSLLRTRTILSDEEFTSLVDFLRNGLLDKRADPQHLRHLVPPHLPSGRSPLMFEFDL